jgi:hypothetical protein
MSWLITIPHDRHLQPRQAVSLFLRAFVGGGDLWRLGFNK